MNIKNIFDILTYFGFKLREPVKQLDDKFLFSQWNCEKVSSKKIDTMVLILKDQFYTKQTGVRITEDGVILGWVVDKRKVLQEMDYDEVGKS